jgi:hypothetical protein
MDFKVIPDILKGANPKEPRSWTLAQMGELLKVTYEITGHPILKDWMFYEPLDIFVLAMKNPDKYKILNRTIVAQTIWQSQDFSFLKLHNGVVTFNSNGIEYAISQVEWFLVNAKRFYRDSIQGAMIENTRVFRQISASRLEASLMYFLTVCNDLVTLTYKHAIADGLIKIESDEQKVKFLFRQKANLLQLKAQFDEKTFMAITNYIEIELGYYKDVKEFFEVSSEIKAILDRFLAERTARISNTKLLGHLLEENFEEFCKDLSELVLRVFSYHDLGGEEPEKVYHYFLAGIFTGFKDYQVISNKESGKGRFDILLIPDRLEYKGVVIEVKRSQTANEASIDSMLQEALKQIVTNKYAIELKIRGHRSYIGMAAVFYGKSLFLKFQEHLLE